MAGNTLQFDNSKRNIQVSAYLRHMHFFTALYIHLQKCQYKIVYQLFLCQNVYILMHVPGMKSILHLLYVDYLFFSKSMKGELLIHTCTCVIHYEDLFIQIFYNQLKPMN